MRLPAARIGLIALALFPMGGCGSDIAAPESDQPFLYLVLNQQIFGEGGVRQRALLLTTGTPLSSEYRSAERFEMRRSADGALFAWEELDLRGKAPVSVTGADVQDGNYRLPDTATSRGLGFEDLEPGMAYGLLIQTGGRVIRGDVTIPSAFAIQWEQASRTAAWPRVHGATGYSVTIGLGAPRIQTDTAVTVPIDVVGEQLRVLALDPNLYRYMTDDEAARSGIDAGFGVFGAISAAHLRLSGTGLPSVGRAPRGR